MSSFLHYPLSFEEIKLFGIDCNIIVYTELSKYKNINELFNKLGDSIIILYLLQSKNMGHYVCLFKDTKNKPYFFDSFGFDPDFELDKLTKEQRIEFNEKRNELDRMLGKKFKNYNEITYQHINYDTCGWHCLYRIKNKNLNEEDYLKLFYNVKNPDLFVVNELLLSHNILL